MSKQALEQADKNKDGKVGLLYNKKGGTATYPVMVPGHGVVTLMPHRPRYCSESVAKWLLVNRQARPYVAPQTEPENQKRKRKPKAEAPQSE